MADTSHILSRLQCAAPPREPSTTTLAPGVSDLASLPPVGVILNPRSHRNKGHELEIIDEPGVFTVMPGSKPELESALADFARREIGILAISGGDGTIRDVLTRAAPFFGDKWPHIVILPKGKTNALAIDLGLPAKWSLLEALAVASEGRSTVRRPIIIDRLDAEQRHLFGFILGAGVFNAAIEAGQVAHRFGAFQSLAVGMTAVFGVVQALFGFGAGPWRRPWEMQLLVNKEMQELPRSPYGTAGTRFFAGFTTLTKFPVGLKPFPGKSNDREILYLVMDAPLRRAVAMVPPVLFGHYPSFLPEIGIHRGAVEELEMDLADSFILDGETFPAGKYRVSSGPELRFIVP